MYLGHVNMYVRNAEKSAEFYRAILGLHTYHTAPGRAVSCRPIRKSRTRSR